MVKRDGKAPKFKAKGAETRHLVPFALIAASELAAKCGTAHAKTVLALVQRLCGFYNQVAPDEYNARLAADHARQLYVLYSSLSVEASETSDIYWRIKPKLNLFVELVEFQGVEVGNPRLFWAYKDEDFVGWIAQLCHQTLPVAMSLRNTVVSLIYLDRL